MDKIHDVVSHEIRNVLHEAWLPVVGLDVAWELDHIAQDSRLSPAFTRLSLKLLASSHVLHVWLAWCFTRLRTALEAMVRRLSCSCTGLLRSVCPLRTCSGSVESHQLISGA